MSTEQSEQGETQPAQSQVDITQQATTTTLTPTTAARIKNPKRVAAGKLVAERTRLAREQQKKAAAEAAIIIANNKAKATAPASNCVAAPEPDPPTEDETPKSTEDINKVDNSILSTTQWIAVGSLIASLIGIYYKRKELKAAFSKKTPEPQPVRAPQPSRVTQPRGLKLLD